jgi:antitoxin HicB
LKQLNQDEWSAEKRTARRLGCDEKAVRRLRDPLHASRITQLEDALHVLGKRIEISVLAG